MFGLETIDFHFDDEKAMTSITKTTLVVPSMNGGMPFEPYAELGGLVMCRIPPIFIPGMPIFQHLSELRFPRVNSVSDVLERNSLDSGDTLYLIFTMPLFSTTAPFPNTLSSTITPPDRTLGP